MKVSNGAVCDVVSLSSFEGIPSGPAALWGCRLVNRLYTPSTSTIICELRGTGSLLMFGGET